MEVILLIRHNNSHDKIDQKPYAKTQESQYKNYSYHGRVDIHVIGQTAADTKKFLSQNQKKRKQRLL